MSIPKTTKSSGGPFDVVYRFDGKVQGFITKEPPPTQQASDFAPPIRLGGDAAFSAESYDQIPLHSFHHGGDKELFEASDQRYRWSDGGAALHREGYVTLASQWAVEDASQVATARQIVDFAGGGNEYICMAAGVKLRLYDNSSQTWADEGPAGDFGANAVYLFSNDQYLFVACGTGDNFYRWDGTKTTGWAQPSASDATCFGWYEETLYRGLSNQIIAATNNNGSTWGAAINVGWPTTDVEDIYEAAGYLIIAKPEGLYLYDGTEVYRIYDAAVVRASGNFVGAAVWEGLGLYLPKMNQVHKAIITSVRDISMTDITPVMRQRNNDKMQYGHGQPKLFFAGPRHLYAAFDAGENVYPEILSYTGVGWHQIYRGASGDTLNAAGYSRIMSWLLVNDGSTRRKRLINSSDAEYPDYAANGVFTTPLYDGGYPSLLKTWKSIEVNARDVDADNSILVKYQLNEDTTWTTIGTITKEGPNELPIGGIEGQVSSKLISFQFTLSREAGDVTKTPVIELPCIIRTKVRPLAIMMYSDLLLLGEDVPLRNQYGVMGDASTLVGQKEFLDEMNDTTATILRIDMFGQRRRVQVTNMDITHPKQLGTKPKTVSETPQVMVTLIDVFSGKYRQAQEQLKFTISITTTLVSDTSMILGTSSIGLSTLG